jgi:hypothetical protein
MVKTDYTMSPTKVQKRLAEDLDQGEVSFQKCFSKVLNYGRKESDFALADDGPWWPKEASHRFVTVVKHRGIILDHIEHKFDSYGNMDLDYGFTAIPILLITVRDPATGEERDGPLLQVLERQGRLVPVGHPEAAMQRVVNRVPGGRRNRSVWGKHVAAAAGSEWVRVQVWSNPRQVYRRRAAV